MKNSNWVPISSAKAGAFTLIELLIVIAIIALLLAILVPGLNKAQELARRAVCSSHLQSLVKASTTYSSAYNGHFVPASYTRSSGAGTEKIYWMANKTFRKYIQIDDFKSGTSPESDFVLPAEFLCPTDKISKDILNISDEGVLTSYGYNVTDWDNTQFNFANAGHRAESINRPAEKLYFIDGIDWWVSWRYADYRRGWDAYGQQNINYYKDRNVHGPAFYRHNEGAVIGFYDGHAEWMKKQLIYVIEDFPTHPGMWANSNKYTGPTWQPPIVP